MKTSLVLLALIGIMALSTSCFAQSYYNSTQEINRQQHQIEVNKQQQQILQQQYIQQHQLEQVRRDAEIRATQPNSRPEHLHLPRF